MTATYNSVLSRKTTNLIQEKNQLLKYFPQLNTSTRKIYKQAVLHIQRTFNSKLTETPPGNREKKREHSYFSKADFILICKPGKNKVWVLYGSIMNHSKTQGLKRKYMPYLSLFRLTVFASAVLIHVKSAGAVADKSGIPRWFHHTGGALVVPVTRLSSAKIQEY